MFGFLAPCALFETKVQMHNSGPVSQWTTLFQLHTIAPLPFTNGGLDRRWVILFASLPRDLDFGTQTVPRKAWRTATTTYDVQAPSMIEGRHFEPLPSIETETSLTLLLLLLQLDWRYIFLQVKVAIGHFWILPSCFTTRGNSLHTLLVIRMAKLSRCWLQPYHWPVL